MTNTNEDASEMTTQNVGEDKEQVKGEAKAAERAKKPKQPAREAKGQETQEVTTDKPYEGTVKIIIQSPIVLTQLNNFTNYLKNIPELKIILTGGSVREGNKIIISLEQPIPLLKVLTECSVIEELGTRGRDIIVTLKGE